MSVDVSNRSRPLPGIQACRGLAALAVVAFHLSIMMGTYGLPAFARDETQLGYLGVDFFFVLSGFIIVLAHQRDLGVPSQLPRYIWRRLARIYPLYWLILGVFLVMWAIGGRTHLDLSSWRQWATAITLVRFSAERMPINPAWTLVHEMAFYTVFALAIAHRRLGAAVFVGWMLWCLVAFQYPQEVNRTPLLVYSSAYNLNFAVGLLAFIVFRRRLAPRAVMVAGIVVVVVNGLLQVRHLPSTELAYGFGFGGIVAGVATLDAQGRLAVPGWLVALGDASYVLYLSHESIMSATVRLLAKGHAHLPAAAIYAVCMLAAVAFALAARALIERPLVHRAQHLRLPTRAHRTAGKAPA